MRRLIALAALLLASAAYAATTYTEGGWQLVGSSITTQNAASYVDCKTQWNALADPIRQRTVYCRQQLVTKVTADPPPPTGTATVSWTPPTQNTDGSALTDLAGYRIRYGTSSASLTQSVTAAAGATSALVGSLPSGPHYFAVTAYTASGLESAPSTIVSKAIP